MKRIDACFGGLQYFIANSPSSYHAVDSCIELLAEHGFKEFHETENWEEKYAEHKYGYVQRDGALIAWIRPDEITENVSFQIVGTHTDSPGFKLKPIPFSTGPGNSSGFTMANLEVYGGPILSSWFDRELEFSGRVIDKEGNSKLFRSGPIARIPNLAIHLYRKDNVEIHRQKDLQAIVSSQDSPESMERYIDEKLLSWDLIATPLQPPHRFGSACEFVAASRLDNLSSVYCALTGIVAAKRWMIEMKRPSKDFVIFAAFDHEEIGSQTRTGAAGPFLEDVLSRLASIAGIEGEDLRAAYARSFCVSADAAHSIHPNYIEKHDPHTAPIVNEGPVIKFNANQRYATDPESAARWLRICKAQNVPVQYFVSNNDVPCGSTIGPITATRLGIPTVDVGVPLLSMHSSREMCGVYDIDWFHVALTGFFIGSGKYKPSEKNYK
ncbi:MAG: M18 family aminopeptidase [Corynebacterium sp.]|nr:M18 family aminopeptidase [Corynebacterium sp.]